MKTTVTYNEKSVSVQAVSRKLSQLSPQPEYSCALPLAYKCFPVSVPLGVLQVSGGVWAMPPPLGVLRREAMRRIPRSYCSTEPVSSGAGPSAHHNNLTHQGRMWPYRCSLQKNKSDFKLQRRN